MAVYTPQQIANLSAELFGEYGPGMVALMTQIALEESGGNTSIIGDNYKSGHQSATSRARYDYGLWQINSQHGYDTTRLVNDPKYNGQAAVEILESQGVGAWATAETALSKLGLSETLVTSDLWSIASAVGSAMGALGGPPGAWAADQIGGFFNRGSGESVTPEDVAATNAPAGSITNAAQLPPALGNAISGLAAQNYSFVSYKPGGINIGGGQITQIGGQAQFLDPMGRLVTFTIDNSGNINFANPRIQDIGLGTNQAFANGRLVPTSDGNMLDPGSGILYAPDGRILADPNGQLAQAGIDVQWYNAATARERAEVDAALGFAGINYNYAQLDLDRQLGFDQNAVARERIALDTQIANSNAAYQQGQLEIQRAQLGLQQQELDLARQGEARADFIEPGQLGVDAFQSQTQRDLGKGNLFSAAFGNETNRIDAESSALAQGGGLMSQLAQTLAQMGSDPGSAVEREFLTRALLQPGTPQSVPISGMIQDLISRLTDPTRFEGEGRSPYEGYDSMPDASALDYISQLQALFAAASAQNTSTAPPPAPNPNAGQTTVTPTAPTGPNLSAIAAQFANTSGTRNPYATPTPAGYQSPSAQARAATTSPGTPKVNPSTPIEVRAPVVQKQASDAFSGLLDIFHSAGINAPTGKGMSAASGNVTTTRVNPNNDQILQNYLNTGGFEEGGTTNDEILEVGDHSEGEPNPEIILNPEHAELVIVPVSDLIKGTSAPKPKGKKSKGKATTKGIPKYQFGTLSGMANSVSQAQQGNLTTTPNEAWQNLPALQYLRGNTGEAEFRRLAQGELEGAFGSRAPLSGMLNIGKVLTADREGASPILSAIYKAAGLDYNQEVGRAMGRAPIGNAVNTSIIRT